MIKIHRTYHDLNRSNKILEYISEIMQYLRKTSPVLLNEMNSASVFDPTNCKLIIILFVAEEYHDLFESLVDCI